MSRGLLVKISAAPGEAATIALVAEPLLVGEAVAAGLATGKFVTVIIPWPERHTSIARTRRTIAASGASLGIVVCGLSSPLRVRRVCLLVASGPVPLMVLTDTPPGPRWGMVIEAGAIQIVAHSTAVGDLIAEVSSVLRGRPGMDPALRRRVLREWDDVDPAQRDLILKVGLLTTGEARVLEWLYDGHSVRQIADLSGMAEATVRTHVTAVRRKLAVGSQVAAVAIFARVLETFPREEHQT